VFVLKKILAAFFIPPGLFVTLLAGAAVWLLIKKRKGIKLLVFLFGLAVLVWALSSAPVSDLLTRSLEKAVPQPKNPQGDVIIVLHGTGQRLGPAVSLQSNLKIPLVLCGYNYLEEYPEEEARLRRSLQASGIPAEMLIIETESRDTLENIRFAKAICRERGFVSPLVVTSAFHSRRVRLTCRKQGFKAVIVPVSYTVLGQGIRYRWRDWLPLAEGLYKTSLALNEYLGLVFYGIAY